MSDASVAYGCAVLTISTGGFQGTREDRSGPEAQALLRGAGFQIVATALVPDDLFAIGEVLTRWTDVQDVPLIVTSGGTGLSPYDLTPEATRSVLHREAPGIAEAMRLGTLVKTPMAMLSRGLAGTRNRTLIVNLPGSPKGVRECLEVILPVLPHAVALLRQDPTTH